MSTCTENPERKARHLGLRLVRPKPHEVFIDCDSLEAYERMQDLIVVHRSAFPGLIEEWEGRTSRTPDHFHVVVTLARPVADATERVLLQLALGSDQKREILALKQIGEGKGDDSSVFFEAA